VATWILDQPLELLFTTSVSQSEILSGLAVMPEGLRRRDLETAARAIAAHPLGETAKKRTGLMRS
jgi:hypothetical protein